MRKVDLFHYSISFSIVGAVIAVVGGITMDMKWMEDTNIFMCWVILLGLFLFVFTIVHLVLFNFGNFIRGIYFKIYGYSFFPLVLYPLCINWDSNHLKIRFTLRPSIVFYDFFTNENMNNIGIEKKLELIKGGLYVKKYSRFFLIIVGAVYCCRANLSYIFVVGALLIEMFIFSNLHDRRFHGESVKITNIKNGKGMIYLIGLEDTYYMSEFDDGDKLVALFSKTENRNYILAGIKRILVERIVMEKCRIPAFVGEILELLWEKPEKISLNPDEKELDVTVLFMYYALISKDVAATNRVLCVIQSLQNEWGNYSRLWYNYFQWYVEMIEFSRGQRMSITVKEQPMLLVKTDSIGYMPGIYYNNLRKVETVVKEKILKR